ncbi:MAG: hydrogenase maturation protease [Anaerolineales bacterium]
MTTILVGLGTTLRSDDELGLAAVQRWQARFGGRHPDLIVELLECPGIELLPLINGHERAILVDSIQAPSAAGVLHLEESDLSAFSSGTGSAHGWGVAETLALARSLPTESTPTDIRILGLPVLSIDPGPLDAAASNALLEAAVLAIEAELAEEPLSTASAS